MQNQVEQFITQADKAIQAAGAPPLDRDAPKVPFQSNLKLTAEQEKAMIDHAFKRMKQISAESGRDVTLNPVWWNNATWGASVALASQGLLPTGDTFMGKRSRFDATFLNDVSWRPFTMGPDTIFNSSNISVPLVRRICRQMIARAKSSFFGSDPWFSINPAPVPMPAQSPGGPPQQDDDGRAERIERFCQFKVRESDSREDKERAISRALILGECAVKTSYVVRDQIFNTEATVLHGIDGQPVRAQDGNVITQDDQWQSDQMGNQVLQRDGVTPQPDAPIWATAPLDRRQVLFEGARSEVIYYKDFLCPLSATSVQEADCIVHLYDKPVMEFVDLVVKRGMVGDSSGERIGAAQKMIALVKSLSENSPQPKAAQEMEQRPNDHYASTPSIETGGPVSEFAEFYMWYDANGDGIAENIMLIADKQSQAPIFYEHVANVTTDGLRPIEIVRINAVEGRWYGLGIMELFESYGTITDLLVNRWNFSQSRAGRVDFWRPTDTLEGDRDPNLKMNWGATYTAKPGVDIEGILKPVYLTDTKFEAIHEMIQFFMQLAMNESGVTNANDDQAAGMQSAKLATGIIEVQKSGDELFEPIIQDLRGPLRRVLDREISVILANINPVEAFTYLHGDAMGIDQITPDDVRGMKYRTEIELTTMRNNTQLQMSAQAAALVEKFYLLSPEVQARVAPFYRQQLRILDTKADADLAIQPITPQPPQSEPPKLGVTVAIKGENLSPLEREQLIEKMGVQEPSPSKIPTDNGTQAKLGDAGSVGGTNQSAQLTQMINKKNKRVA